MAERTKYILDESEMPTTWYNVVPDLPQPPPPPLHPGTHQPVGPDDLAPLFPMALIGQEVSGDRYIDIPGAVLDIYTCGGRHRSTGHTDWRRRSTPRRASTSSMRA